MSYSPIELTEKSQISDEEFFGKFPEFVSYLAVHHGECEGFLREAFNIALNAKLITERTLFVLRGLREEAHAVPSWNKLFQRFLFQDDQRSDLCNGLFFEDPLLDPTGHLRVEVWSKDPGQLIAATEQFLRRIDAFSIVSHYPFSMDFSTREARGDLMAWMGRNNFEDCDLLVLDANVFCDSDFLESVQRLRRGVFNPGIWLVVGEETTHRSFANSAKVLESLHKNVYTAPSFSSPELVWEALRGHLAPSALEKYGDYQGTIATMETDGFLHESGAMGYLSPNGWVY